MRFVVPTLLAGFSLWGLLLGPYATACAEGVKTHFKKYTIFTLGQTDYLCEPYTVKKHDWLYKILRQKGEISAADFPKFLRIFQYLNPQLSNIDAIEPGNKITIPLKEVDKNTYDTSGQRSIEVPVLEFSVMLSPKKVDEYVNQHLVQKGDTISKLLDQAFLEQNGAVSEIGKKTINSLNPSIKNIDRIYAGSNILIPEPGILNQPWFESLLNLGYANIINDGVAADAGNGKMTHHPSASQEKGDLNALPVKPPVVLAPRDIRRLKRYAQQIQGVVKNQGKVYFPRKNGQPAKILDLSQIPVLETSNGEKTLILPGDTLPTDLDAGLIDAMKAHWRGARLQPLNQVLKGDLAEKNPMTRSPSSLDTLIDTLLSKTPYSYNGKATFHISLKHIEMQVSMGRITHNNKSDILVNKGNIYGKAIDILNDQGYKILDLTAGLSVRDTIIALFSKIGYETWENPSFYDHHQIQKIQGIYVVKGLEKTLIITKSLSENTTNFLVEEGIKILQLGENTGL
ncbi:MAG: hypothetical protein CSA29_03905 [Desulfobacterales bacterium]|nr:MAG: hypothetical protein CSA29_03905 [Desulfobacterales bacterium]